MKKLITKYLNQEAGLPDDILKHFESEEVKFYALSDIAEDGQLKDTWIVLTKYELKVFGEFNISIMRDDITKTAEVSGQSINQLSVYANDEVFAKMYFSQRQSILFSGLKYILDEGLKGNDIEVEDADLVYQKSLTQKLLAGQGASATSKGQVVWRLLGYLKPYRKDVFFGALGALLATLLALIPAYLSGSLIDEIIRPFQNGELNQDEGMKKAMMILVFLASAYFLKEIFIWVRLKKMSILGELVARDLRKELYAHLQRLEMDYFNSKQTGSIISRVSSDTDRIWDFIALGIVEVSISVMSLICLSAVLISLDLKLGLLMSIPVPVLIFCIFRHGQNMQGLFLKAWSKWSDLTDIIADTMSGMQVVKSFGKEKVEEERFNKNNEVTLEQFNGIHLAWTRFWPLLMLGIHLIIFTVWVFAMPRMMTNSQAEGYLSAGTFVSFLLYMTMFSTPIEVIGQMARMVNRATSSAFRIFEVLDTVPSIKNGAVEAKDVRGDIQIKDAFFSYDGVRNVLKGINLHIQEGEMIGLVGPSGGGKSTITKLISRFYDLNAGDLLIDGRPIKDYELMSLRSSIGVVAQDPYLFHGSVLDNIRYSKPEATLSEVIKAAKIANAHNFIVNFNDGYETTVGERGQTLSGGERQRLSIARAILNDPKILILDEATSAVDTETERNIQQALDSIVKGRTVIAIAHRLSTLRKANRIIVLKDGVIAESGTHRNLMDNGGVYKKLQDMQNEMHQLMHGGTESEMKNLGKTVQQNQVEVNNEIL
jgi:ATP-binding cassette subfamily B protein